MSSARGAGRGEWRTSAGGAHGRRPGVYDVATNGATRVETGVVRSLRLPAVCTVDSCTGSCFSFQQISNSKRALRSYHCSAKCLHTCVAILFRAAAGRLAEM
eukprot:2109801-Prymnesium_polylepis.1